MWIIRGRQADGLVIEGPGRLRLVIPYDAQVEIDASGQASALDEPGIWGATIVQLPGGSTLIVASMYEGGHRLDSLVIGPAGLATWELAASDAVALHQALRGLG